jgi:hypothetical protein
MRKFFALEITRQFFYYSSTKKQFLKAALRLPSNLLLLQTPRSRPATDTKKKINAK